jgi:uncharacterized protein YfkK (UPF0435 family)
MDAFTVIPADVATTIEEILFKREILTSTEKVKMCMVSKVKMDSFINERYVEISRIYDVVKTTSVISVSDYKFVKKQIDFIIENEIDIPANSDEASEEYKDYLYNLYFNFAFHKLYVLYLVLEYGKETEKDEYYDLTIDDEKTKKCVADIHSKLKYRNYPCEVTDINSLQDFMEFGEKLTIKQKTIVGM